MARPRSGERREEILQVLARMLQEQAGEHITTADLARAVGVSEAALYRHFPSKAKMFESLIEFIEESVFTRITRILAEEPQWEARLQQILTLVLGFADKNPGMARLLQGGVLTGETERLRVRISQFYDRIETQLRQVLRDGEAPGSTRLAVNETAQLLLAFLEGRIAQYVRSGFTASPMEGWEKQWELLSRGALRA
ncbi:MAG TPA: nucleoid occlusion factor SlmA [Acidiferrobacterales bacterium]|nr:nucleoid occlusion factor SlmA [Acidiferrobacterales bacterium]